MGLIKSLNPGQICLWHNNTSSILGWNRVQEPVFLLELLEDLGLLELVVVLVRVSLLVEKIVDRVRLFSALGGGTGSGTIV